ncbi:uncharacterized protein [Euwallacea similis]|uniref:uncharacterized protein isoform X2 n=1 Tax=Euwallacea similis TaxID=1736056 RepID=UPI00344C8475
MGDVKRSKTAEKLRKTIDIFQITRPNKANKLLRTNSLPPGKKSFELDDSVSVRSWTNVNKGNEQKIKKKIEVKSAEVAAVKLPNWDISQQRIIDLNPATQQSRIEFVREVSHERLSEKSSSVSINTVLSGFSGGTVKELSETSENKNTLNSHCKLVNKDNQNGFNEFQSCVQPHLHLFSSNSNLDPIRLWNHTTPFIQPRVRHNSDDLCTETGSPGTPSSPISGVQPKFNEEYAYLDNTNMKDSIERWKNKVFVHAVPQSSVGRFVKNPTRSSTRPKTDRRKTGVGMIKDKPLSVLELTAHFEGFKDAAERGQTEMFKKFVICEMDQELKNMENDGFTEELSFENLHSAEDINADTIEDGKWEEEFGKALMMSIENKPVVKLVEHPSDDNVDPFKETTVQETADDDDPLGKATEQKKSDVEDPFGETYFDEGLVYLEAYNQDDKELVECTVQVDRRSVDLQSFNKIQQSHDLLAQNEQMMVLMNEIQGDPESKRNTIYSTTSAETGDSENGCESKRNTIYSTTSGDSFEDEDNPGGCLWGDNVSVNYRVARRETYCDDQGRVRIERVAPCVNDHQENSYVNTANQLYESADIEEEDNEHEYEIIQLEHDMNFFTPNPEVKKDPLQYIAEEIVSTERKYLSDMDKVLRKYKEFVDERCPDKSDLVFGNMEQIFSKQLEFLHALENTQSNVHLMLETFIYFDDLFRLYPRYFRNTPTANATVKEINFLLKERQEIIQDKLDLSAYLLTPVQRLGKYKLFLENIIKQLEKENKPLGQAQDSLAMIKKFLSRGNDSVAIASILRSPLHTKDYGSFIAREIFTMLKPRKMEIVVFLFEGVVVFTQEDPKNMEQFQYLQSIKTDDLRIATFDDDCSIQLTNFTMTKRRNSSKYTYVLDAKSPKLKESWKKQIEDILWKQMKKLKEDNLKRSATLTPIPLERAQVRNRNERYKSTGSATFYVE